MTILAIHQSSRGAYGSPRVHAELRLAAGVRCGRKRVARQMPSWRTVTERTRPGRCDNAASPVAGALRTPI